MSPNNFKAVLIQIIIIKIILFYKFCLTYYIYKTKQNKKKKKRKKEKKKEAITFIRTCC